MLPSLKSPAFLFFTELLLLFALLFVHGSWPVPDVNEVCYVGKAIRFWNPDWIRGDTFLESQDAHYFFYVTVGWPSLVLSPTVFAWTARCLAWFLFALAWQRFSYVLIPKRFASILTAAGLLYLLDTFTMSGEWLIGGVEGKSFAFPLMFLGLEFMLRGKWHRVWPCLGLASAFHVIVGGWAVLLAMFVYLLECGRPWDRRRLACMNLERGRLACIKSLVTQIPFLLLGGAFSLFGLIPALLLDYGVASETASQAHFIYVYERLAHHLHPAGFPWTFQLRFGVLTLLWVFLCLSRSPFSSRSSFPRRRESRNGATSLGPRLRGGDTGSRNHNSSAFWRLNGFVFGTLILAGIGFFIAWFYRDDPKRCSDWLRFYWFRMCDFAVPMGVSFLSVALLFRFAKLWGIVLRKCKNPIALVRKSLAVTVVSFGIGAFVFLLIDAMLFGWCFASRLNLPSNPGENTPDIPAEPVVSWILALIFGVVTLAAIQKYAKRKNIVPICAWLVLLGTVVVWGPLNFYSQRSEQRMRFAYSRSGPASPRYAHWWNGICRWIAEEENGIERDARFLTPKELGNFKWLAQRPEVGTWKDIPQDAKGIIEWHARMEEIYIYRPKKGPPRRDIAVQYLLKRHSPQRIESLRKKYDFEYILCAKYPPLDLPVVYENPAYAIYRAKKEP